MRPIFPNTQLNALQDLLYSRGFLLIEISYLAPPSATECQKGQCKLFVNYAE